LVSSAEPILREALTATSPLYLRIRDLQERLRLGEAQLATPQGRSKHPPDRTAWEFFT
jgi:hypothetical protein